MDFIVFEEDTELQMNGTRNGTNLTDYDFYDIPTIYYVWHVFTMITYLAGLVGNGLIIHAIISNTQMRSRTNKIILTWSISDLISELMSLILDSYFMYSDTIDTSLFSQCFLWHTDIIMKFMGFLFLTAITFNTLVRTKLVTDSGLLWICWGVVLTLVVINTNLCIFNKVYIVLYFAYLSVFVFLIAVLIFKHINMYCKKRKNNPVSDRTKFRLMLATIYVFNWCITWLVEIISSIFYKNVVLRYLFMLSITGSLSSVYMLIYLVRADNQFRIYMCKVLRRNYDADATVNFSEFNGEEPSNEGKVTVDIGEDGKTVKRQRE